MLQHNQSRNPPVSRLKRREEVIWSKNRALWPKHYSAMNLWIALAQIFVYCTVHFKIESDGCLSLAIHLCGCVTLLPVIHAPTFLFFALPLRQTPLTPVHFSCFVVFQVPSLRKLGVFTATVHYAIDTRKPFIPDL